MILDLSNIKNGVGMTLNYTTSWMSFIALSVGRWASSHEILILFRVEYFLPETVGIGLEVFREELGRESTSELGEYSMAFPFDYFIITAV